MELKNLLKSFLLISASAVATQSQAVTYGFDCITGNVAGDCSIGEAQLTVDVTDAGAGQVLFTFNNAGPEASSITDVYFDDGSISSISAIASIDNSVPGVNFSIGAAPPDLPGGNSISPAFNATVGLTADSNPPTQPRGVNPGETLGILVDLSAGVSYADLLSDISSMDLRIGIHVQGYATGGSESFINNVPVPAAVWLFGSGLLGLVGVARRKHA
jgi:hypothetical protein